MSKPVKTANKTVLTLFAALSLLGLSGCSAVRTGTNEMKAVAVEPAPDAGFIEHPERQVKRVDLPFQKVWIKPGFDKQQYKELVVTPVNTQYMLEMDWLHNMSSATWISDVKADIAELARYFHHQVVQAFQKDPKHRFQVIERPEQHRQPALRLELALIEINPSQPVLHALS